MYCWGVRRPMNSGCPVRRLPPANTVGRVILAGGAVRWHGATKRPRVSAGPGSELRPSVAGAAQPLLPRGALAVGTVIASYRHRNQDAVRGSRLRAIQRTEPPAQP